MKKYFSFISAITFSLFFLTGVYSQKIDSPELKQLVEEYKKDPRGPYKAIRWFCTDGSSVPADQRCSQPGGVQRAQYKDEVEKLGRTNHIFLGQILATTDYRDFLDSTYRNSRLKQYILEKFLKLNDNGWIQRRSQFYRGAVQLEDEEEWGSNFFEWLLKDDRIIRSKFYLIREAFRDIPQKGKSNLTQRIRAVSKSIADSVSSFMDIRIKLHGNPEQGDVQKVKDYYDKNYTKLKVSARKEFENLITDLETLYSPAGWDRILKLTSRLRDANPLKKEIEDIVKLNISGKENASISEKTGGFGSLLLKIRKEIESDISPKSRMLFLNLSLDIEEIFSNRASEWHPVTLEEMIEKNLAVGEGIAGTGQLEIPEWEKISKVLKPRSKGEITYGNLADIVAFYGRLLEWGTSMVTATFKDAVDLYSGFEPLSAGLIDDKLRSSLLLQAGIDYEKFNEYYLKKIKLPNYVFGTNSSLQVRGINPGYSAGKLIVADSDSLISDPNPENIYVFYRPPSDLKPVAGILNVTEGNALSHVQLLARNLGIPNAVVSPEVFENLKKYDGQPVFYAVSEMGTVVLKTASEMTPEEKNLVEKKKRSDDRVSVPVDKLNLNRKNIINLRNVKSVDSGKLCGPKAANLGQLKYFFPENVVEGFVIPFGIFRDHMDQMIPGEQISYWQYLQETFKKASEIRVQKDADKFVLERLKTLRDLIMKMSLKPEFISDLENSFHSILGKQIGDVCVFLRSDTNMEDLKDFTGAGLNLTLFNVLDSVSIMQGIREVWASPYTERSYQWRQKVLNNPEQVYPSILVIPSVDVEKSGVIITKALYNTRESGITMAFSRGAGGAVEGQSAETYVVTNKGRIRLISPSREMMHRTLPETGGTGTVEASLNEPVLTDSEIYEIQKYSQNIETRLVKEGKVYESGPFDIELGIKNGKIWLFQVRPFVENKRFNRLEYLQSLDPKINYHDKLSLTDKL